ncbi:hypothetical protein TSH100_23250 [Azospirillum sp. TSH100]|nr:hypothetical protein TSH100_23250 [Azospirillum sp. TSH100]
MLRGHSDRVTSAALGRRQIVFHTHMGRIAWIQGHPDRTWEAMHEAMEQALASGHMPPVRPAFDT